VTLCSDVVRYHSHDILWYPTTSLPGVTAQQTTTWI